MEAKVTFYAVGGEEHFPVASQYEQEPVQRLKQISRVIMFIFEGKHIFLLGNKLRKAKEKVWEKNVPESFPIYRCADIVAFEYQNELETRTPVSRPEISVLV